MNILKKHKSVFQFTESYAIDFIKNDRREKDKFLNLIKQDLKNTQMLFKHYELFNNSNKIELTDTTFIIPFKRDFKERQQNLEILINYISKNFLTNIVVFEFDVASIQKDVLSTLKYKTNLTWYFCKSNKMFSRTIVTNFCIDKIDTPVIVLNDVDCISSNVLAYKLCETKIINNEIDLIHPFCSPPGTISYSQKDKDELVENDFVLKPNDSFEIEQLSPPGGIVFINKSKYHDIGNENIYFISYSPEDCERIYRFSKLGYKVEEHNFCYGPINNSIDSALIHMEHPKTPENSNKTKLFKANNDLFECLKILSCENYNEYCKRNNIKPLF